MSTLAHASLGTESGSARPRRPDRAVYVPRALRAHDAADESRAPDPRRADGTEESLPLDSRRADGVVESRPPDGQRADAAEESRSPDSRRTNGDGRGLRSAHGTPKRVLDRHYCNVYTPPPLRPHALGPAAEPVAEPAEPAEPAAASAPRVPNGDSAVPSSDNSDSELVAADNFYIGDYFANGQLGFYRPSFYDYGPGSDDDWAPRDRADHTMAAPLIDDPYGYGKGEDAEADELQRASREINRSSKRIIKQSFDSDVLVISDPVKEAPERPRHDRAEASADREELSTEHPKPKLEAKASLSREENDWDAVFDDSGECLDPSLLEELARTVGRVRVASARACEQYQSLAAGDEAFAHVLEVYDFPSEFKTNDLLALFSEHKDTGFEIKWVDDTHALIVFSSAKIAAEAMSSPRSLARCRPLHAATLESRNKAKKCAEFLQPYRQRPETCTALARRLVSGALGVRLSTAQQERAEERRLITRAREKKRQAALHKEAAWDGSLANTSLDA